MGRKGYQGAIACFLCLALCVTQINVSEAEQTDKTEGALWEQCGTVSDSNVCQVGGEKPSVSDNDVDDNLGSSISDNNLQDGQGDSLVKWPDERISTYYRDGRICIYNYEQLCLIGSGKDVCAEDVSGNEGLGGQVIVDGEPLTYEADGDYYLMADIPLDTEMLWTFPEDFTGTMESFPERDFTGVYEEETDTVYIYNRYQLALLCSGSCEQEPVMTEDYIAERVGMGQVFIREDGSFLTYSRGHRYVLTSDFTVDHPVLIASTTAVSSGRYYPADCGGRSYFGEVAREIDGETYILIGNAKQLRAIGTDVVVTEPVWKVYQKKASSLSINWEVVEDDPDYPTELYYPGDADLVWFDDAYDWSAKGLYGVDKGKHGIGDIDYLDGAAGIGSTKRFVYCGSKLDSETGQLTYDTQAVQKLPEKTAYINPSGAVYSSSANYIIFRDIYLTDSGKENGETVPWKPIDSFTGTLEGRLEMQEGVNAAVHNVKIEQSLKIDQSGKKPEYGVGFFRNLSTPYDSALNFSDKAITISNLTLDQVEVSNKTSEINTGFSLIDVTLSPVLELLGIGGLSPDPQSLATGALAGVVKGNVVIKNCRVTNLSGVTNVNDWTGGLVGYCSGITKYSALTGLAAGITAALSTLLNLVPVLGLGDLVTILLGSEKGILPLGSLIPIGYTNAVISDCSVIYTDSAEVAGRKMTGGFVGEAVGTVMSGCKVENNGSTTVKSSDYAGGFVGKASNAVIVGALENIGIELLADLPVNTALLNCDIIGNGILDVGGVVKEEEPGYSESTQPDYVGGFAGCMGNSYAVDCDISCLGNVSGQKYVGGFTGKASLGDAADISENKGLLNVVQALLSACLTGSKDTSLLSLVGLQPSVITGCHIQGKEICIKGTGSYVGGLAGYGGALQVSNTADLKSDGESAAKSTSKAFARILGKTGILYSLGDNRNQIQADQTLTVSGADYVGGVLGAGRMTSVADVLTNAVTAADYMRFELRNVTVEAKGGIILTSVASGSCAGGAIGSGIGGEVKDVQITGLSSVTAGQYAGGFAGSFGSGRLADIGGGINLLGQDFLKVDGILSVADMIETMVADSVVTGGQEGLEVTASGDDGAVGGFIGSCVSARVSRCSVTRLKKVTASGLGGAAGGMAGCAKAGDALAGVGDKVSTDSSLNGIQIENLLGIVSALTPEFDGSGVIFLPGGGEAQVQADIAGGFLGDGEAVDINYSKNKKLQEGQDFWTTEVSGLEKVSGMSFAGGFAGRLSPGDIAQTGSVKLLGLLNVDQLLRVMDVAYPRISRASVAGSALAVAAAGRQGDVTLGDAGGYIGSGRAITVEYSLVTEVKEVMGASRAGGFIGVMSSGTAVEVSDEEGALLNSILGQIADIQQLAGVLQCAGCDLTACKVSGVEQGMYIAARCRQDNEAAASRAMAGGFVGEMQSGTVDNSIEASEGRKGTAVENLAGVEGLRYAGGFAGRAKAGAVAQVAQDSALLTHLVTAADLVTVINTFVPVIRQASVRSVDTGFTVAVIGTDQEDNTQDVHSGSAGGFIGYASGVQVSGSDVDRLANTDVLEPEELGGADGSSYFGADSAYAVTAYRNAGGYFGKLDIGSTAAVGGTGILGRLISVSSVASALNVVVSTAEHCDVYGAPGGFNILASNTDGTAGMAGGFAGNLLGSQLQDCNVRLFAHVIGRESAGGYAGTMEPGSAAEALGDVSILGGLISADNLLGVLRTFVPTVKNSETTCIPCGGVVRADAAGGDGVRRGMAGGYTGYNLGGQIWGNDNEDWKGGHYSGPLRACGVVRIRSVYGVECAGGYTGLMQCANVVDTGSLSLLHGVIKLDNPLAALQAVYPTEKETRVIGPLKELDLDTWNSWVTHVGQYGAYGNLLKDLGTVEDQQELEELIRKYAYGYDVTAGRSVVPEALTQAGVAGGYVGRMEGGTITSASAFDLKSVKAFRSAAGFVGEMITGSVAGTGDLSLAGLDLAGSIPILQTFVPVIREASVTGYQSGARILANGTAGLNPAGIAGGYVGLMVGGQIWGSPAASGDRCSAYGLRRVDGTSYVGGFAGKVDPGSAATLDTASSQGLLHQILKYLITSPNDLAKVLGATVSTIRYACASGWDNWGMVVNGSYQGGDTTQYAIAAGGFAGSLSGVVIGEADQEDSGVDITQLRTVVGGEYAGGGFGLADVSSAAQVSGEGDTSIVGLIQAGSVDVLDAFRTYVYHSHVSGSQDAGLSVSAAVWKEEGTGASLVYTGNAGGFGGSLLDGSVKHSTVTGLYDVTAPNQSGGFMGYAGKSGVLDVDKVNVGGQGQPWNLLGGTLGVLDIFGSNIHDCSVMGRTGGYQIQSVGGPAAVAGGFIGYGSLTRIVSCHAGGEDVTQGARLVFSDGIAGGFAGKTDFAYLADIQLDSTLVNLLLTYVVDPLVKALYLDAEGIGSSNLLNITLPGLVSVKAGMEGNLLAVNLLGLKITVGLSKASQENEQETDVAIVTIGDSTVKLPCTKDGLSGENEQNIRITLIKANRTKIAGSSVAGTKNGYDVYGGGAGNKQDGSSREGYSGGFVGYNEEGLLEDNNMYYCDVVRGTPLETGPFTGGSKLDSTYDFNTLESVEGVGNQFRIYRKVNAVLEQIRSASNAVLNSDYVSGMQEPQGFNIYTMNHIKGVPSYADLKGAVMSTADNAEDAGQAQPLNAYVSDAKVVLMDDVDSRIEGNASDTPEPSDIQDPCDEWIDITVNKIWRDWGNVDGRRPQEIIINLSRTWIEQGETKTEAVSEPEGYVLKAGSGNVWQAAFMHLPAYCRDAQGNICYYSYSAAENEVEGYTSSLEVSEDGYTFTFINARFFLLPQTGGRGSYFYWLAGGSLLACLLYTGRRRRKGEGGEAA